MFRKINYQKISPDEYPCLLDQSGLNDSSNSVIEMENPKSLYPIIDPSYLLKPNPDIINIHTISNTNPFHDLIDLSESVEDIRIPITSFQQKVDHIIPDKTLQDTLQTEFEVIKFPYTIQNMPSITSLIIRSKENSINIFKDKITTSKHVLLSLTSNTLKIWDAYYTENRIMAMDGSTVVNGYFVRDFDDNQILVRNKINMNEFAIKICSSNFDIDFRGDNCTVLCDNNLFDGLNINIKARGYSKINLGTSKFASIHQNIQITDVSFLDNNLPTVTEKI